MYIIHRFLSFLVVVLLAATTVESRRSPRGATGTVEDERESRRLPASHGYKQCARNARCGLLVGSSKSKPPKVASKKECRALCAEGDFAFATFSTNDDINGDKRCRCANDCNNGSNAYAVEYEKTTLYGKEDEDCPSYTLCSTRAQCDGKSSGEPTRVVSIEACAGYCFGINKPYANAVLNTSTKEYDCSCYKKKKCTDPTSVNYEAVLFYTKGSDGNKCPA